MMNHHIPLTNTPHWVAMPKFMHYYFNLQLHITIKNNKTKNQGKYKNLKKDLEFFTEKTQISRQMKSIWELHMLF